MSRQSVTSGKIDAITFACIVPSETDYGKLWFNIIDYTGSATRNFADRAFDGEPVLATEEEIKEEYVRKSSRIVLPGPHAWNHDARVSIRVPPYDAHTEGDDAVAEFLHFLRGGRYADPAAYKDIDEFWDDLLNIHNRCE